MTRYSDLYDAMFDALIIGNRLALDALGSHCPPTSAT
jgi:hypothetical protein